MKRISNSFSEAELAVVKIALDRPPLPGLEEEEYRTLDTVIQKALCGADIRQITRSSVFRAAMRKLSDFRQVQTQQPYDDKAFCSVREKINKMLERAEALREAEKAPRGGEDGLEERGA